MKRPGLYFIRNRVTGRIYVGVSANTTQRIRQHRHQLRLGNHHNPILQQSWRKHGEATFQFKHIRTIGELSERCRIEVEIIAKYRAKGKSLYNIGEGGEGQPHTPESRAKISKAKKGKKASAETIRRLAEYNRLRLPPSEETREKLRQTSTGRRYPERNASESYRRIMSENRKKRKNIKPSEKMMRRWSEYLRTRTISDETKRRMSEAKRAAIARGVVSQKTIPITFNGVTRLLSEWAEILGIERRTLGYRIKHWPLERAMTAPVRRWD